jgi:hypothetical protein
LIAGYHWLLKQLYSYENYAKRVIGNLKAYTRKPKIKIYFPTFLQLKIILRTLRYYVLTLDRRRRSFFMQIVKYVLLHKPYAFHDAMVHLVSFKHFHTYVYEYLEHAFTEKMAALEDSLENGKVKLVTACEELGKQAASMSQQAAVAYEELKHQVSSVGQHATEEYDELRNQADVVNNRATVAYEELCHHAAEIKKQALVEYDVLRQHASETISNHPALLEEYEALRKKVATLSERASASYEDVRRQAAVLSEKAETLNQRAAITYKELERQADNMRQRVTQVYQELEQILTRNVSTVVAE